MTPNEKNMLDTFLQYGDDFSISKIIFMGKEEGLGGQPGSAAIPARMSLLTNPIFQPVRRFVNGINHQDGWYINQGGALTQAYGGNPDAVPRHVQVISYQAYFHWLMQGDNRSNANARIGYDWKEYYSQINALNTGSHMIDFYPFPRRGEGAIWPCFYQSEFPLDNHFSSANDYYRFYNSNLGGNNLRWQILTNLYNTFPMEITISYVGYRGGNFLCQNFYAALGFQFGNLMSTRNVNPRFTTSINPSQTKKDFSIGQRVYQGKKQIVVLTPFFSARVISYNDIAVISSWLP